MRFKSEINGRNRSTLHYLILPVAFNQAPMDTLVTGHEALEKAGFK